MYRWGAGTADGAQRLLRLAAFSVAALAATIACGAEPQYLLGTAATDQEAFFADRNMPGVWRLADGKLSLFFEGSRKFRTPLNAVRCLAIDRNGKLLAGDSSMRDIFRFDNQNQPQALTGGEIGIPTGLGVLKSGEIIAADLELHRVMRIPAAGGKPTVYAEVAAPRGIFVDGEDRVWIVSHGKDQLLRGDATGKLETIVAGRPFQFPSSVVVRADGTALVCDTYAKAVWRVAPGKEPAKWASGEPFVSPVSLALQGENVLVADPRAKGLITIDSAGKATLAPWMVAQ
jgi:streptogramin lyase